MKEVWTKIFGIHPGMKVKIHRPGHLGDNKKAVVVSRVALNVVYVAYEVPIHYKYKDNETTVYMDMCRETELEVIE